MTHYGGGVADTFDSGSKFDTASCGGSSVASSNGCHSTTTSATATTAGSGRRAAAAFVAARWGAKVAAGLLHPPRACIRTLHRHLSPSALSPTAAGTIGRTASAAAASAAESTAADAVDPVMVLLEDGSLRMYSSTSDHLASSPSSATSNNAPLTVADVLLDFPNHDLVALAAPCAPLHPATRLDPGSTYCLSALPAAKAGRRGGAGKGGHKPHAEAAAAAEAAAIVAPVSSKARCRCPICHAEAEREREAQQQLRGLWLAGGEVSARLGGDGGDPMLNPGSASPSRSLAKQRLRQRGSAAVRSPRGAAEAEGGIARTSAATSAAAATAPSNGGAGAGAGAAGAGAANEAGGANGGAADQTVNGGRGMADDRQGHGHGKQICKEDDAARLAAAAAIALAGMPCPSPAGARTETSHVGRVTSRELRRHRTSSPDRPSRFPSRFGRAEILRLGMGGESAASPLLTSALPPPGSAPVTPRGGLQPVGKERWGDVREEQGLGETEEEEEFISDVEEREREMHRQRALEELQQAMDKVNAWMEACQEQLRQLQQQGQQD
ncbi:unnamed protein product [Closterium sp. Naga37s-1]|nr:unnamed protein product [Closterium sp. Naga37s-1]